MAVLDETGRWRCWAQLMRHAVFGTAGCSKAELRAALDATDVWLDTNATAYNTALPQPARGALSLQQKTMLLCLVAMRRANLLHAEED